MRSSSQPPGPRTEDSLILTQHKKTVALLDFPAIQVWREMPWRILRASLVNAVFGGTFFLSFVFGTAYMKAVGFTAQQAELIGLIAAAFMLGFMILGPLVADYINRLSARSRPCRVPPEAW